VFFIRHNAGCSFSKNLPFFRSLLGLVDYDGVRDTVKTLAGDKLDRYSLGDLISKALHDADSQGLDVVSQSDASGSTKPFKWRAVEDEKLFPSTPDATSTATQNIVESAVKLSFGEEQQAVRAGMGADPAILAQLTKPAGYRALGLIPAEDTSSTRIRPSLGRSTMCDRYPAT
jgi:hypothetical protein